MSPAIALVAAALIASTPVTSPGPGPLAPGKDAGLHGAQSFVPDNKIVIVVGIGLVVAAALLISSHYDNPAAKQNATGTAGKK